MKVKIISSHTDTWYRNSIGKVFDVEVKEHPTFKEVDYILTDTQFNRDCFKGSKYEEAELLLLKNGYRGIRLNDVELTN